MPKKIDLTGKTFGRLTVTDKNYRKGKHIYWLCLCSCGQTKMIRSDHIRYGEIKSCGCLEDESRKNGNNTKHNLSKTRLFKIFQGMKKRCYNKNSTNYNRYGGRGITICEEWLNDYTSFHKWALSNGYKENLSIDRINVNGNYEPDNCRWADAKMQANNRRPKKSMRTTS